MANNRDLFLDRLNIDFYPHVFSVDETAEEVNGLAAVSGLLSIDGKPALIRWVRITDLDKLIKMGIPVSPECFEDSEDCLYRVVAEKVQEYLKHEKNSGISETPVRS